MTTPSSIVSRLVITTFSISLCTWMGAHAQDKPEPPRRQGSVPADTVARQPEQQLPQIELPEFLIAGKERIDLPEFTRHTLDEERTFDTSSRKPGLGQRENAMPSLGGYVKEHAASGASTPGLSGKVTTAYGTFQTPFFDGWFGRSFGGSDFLLKGGFKSSSGHVLGADYRQGHSSLSGGLYLPTHASFFPAARIDGSIGFRGETFGFYGSSLPGVQRTFNRFNSTLALNSAAGGGFSHTTQLQLRSASITDSSATREVSVAVEFTGSGDVGPLDVKGEAVAATSFYNAPSKQHNPHFMQFGSEARYLAGNAVAVTGGVDLYLYRGSDIAARARFFPKVGLTWYATPDVNLFARFEPHIVRTGLASFIEENPYQTGDVALRPREVVSQMIAGTQIEINPRVKTRTALNYRQIRNLPLYTELTTQGVWTATYTGLTRVLSFEADVHANLSTADYLAASVTVYSNRNSSTTKRTPYSPSAVLSAVYQHRFAFGLTVGANVKLTGQQYVDAENTRSIPSFTLVSLSAEYTVAPGLNVLAIMENSLNQTHMLWSGYAGIPRTGSLGMSYSW